jgi:altered-inheritance-of-mitochondria protein 13
VVNDLSDRLDSSSPSPERQATLDGHIRARIASELAHLREEEAGVRAEIEQALEKENLDREREMAGAEEGGEEGAGNVRSSAALMGDLEEVRSKVEKYQARRELTEFPEVKRNGEAVVECYKCVPPLSLCGVLRLMRLFQKQPDHAFGLLAGGR